MKFNIVNEIKLSYSRKGNCERSIASSRDAVEVFRAHFDAEEMDHRESFFALYLNQANKVLGIKKISECGISSTLVDVRIVMQAALLCNATAMIVAHNHPSEILSHRHQIYRSPRRSGRRGSFSIFPCWIM